MPVTRRSSASSKPAARVAPAKEGEKQTKAGRVNKQGEKKATKKAEKEEEEEDAKASKDDGEIQDDLIPLDVDDSDDSEAEDDEDEAILAGFSDISDGGADSSDEDEEDDRKTGTISTSGVVKLPSSRDDAAVRARLDKAHEKRKRKVKGANGAGVAKPIVLYFGRVPKSMPEDALRAYLTQFGDVRRLRLARNRKTGATKHYAFVEFDDEEVGQIVCETMHNYLLEGRLLQVHVVPKEKQHPNLWVGADRKYRVVPADKLFKATHDKVRSSEQKRRAESKLLHRQEKRRKRLEEQGIDYTFEGYTR